ncbi:MAG: phosphoglycerate kinase [Candidatus Zambryskibacteria bacterium]|nr:phosphoglycerate kinase [Candidatus Zambryskibacteria bacterium]
MIKLPTIEDAGDIAGKHVLLRLDLNTPVTDGKVADPYRIDQAIPTIDMLRLKKAKTIIIAHTEAQDKGQSNTTLLPMWDYLNGFVKLQFAKDLFSAETIKLVAEMEDGDVLMLENLRSNPGEKANDLDFAKQLAHYADLYVNEAFSVSHRTHASVVGVPRLLPSYAGPLFINEVEHLSKAFEPSHPFLFILGGAKFDTKLPLIEKYLLKADSVAVVGALATNIFKNQGFEVGTSLVAQGEFGIDEMLKNPKFVVPTDVTVKKPDGTMEIKKAGEVNKDDYIGDVGSETVETLGELVKKASFIVWNGPLGNYEAGFTEQTEKLAEIIAESGATTIVGGGDTLASIEKLGLMDEFTFASTAGGAMLDFLVNETLPGIEALKK